MRPSVTDCDEAVRGVRFARNGMALGRIGYEPAGGALLDILQSDEEPVRAAAALSLARMGERRALEYCSEQALSTHWPVLPLGLAGDRRSLSFLTQMAERNAAEIVLLHSASSEIRRAFPFLSHGWNNPKPPRVLLQRFTALRGQGYTKPCLYRTRWMKTSCSNPSGNN